MFVLKPTQFNLLYLFCLIVFIAMNYFFGRKTIQEPHCVSKKVKRRFPAPWVFFLSFCVALRQEPQAKAAAPVCFL